MLFQLDVIFQLSLWWKKTSKAEQTAMADLAVTSSPKFPLGKEWVHLPSFSMCLNKTDLWTLPGRNLVAATISISLLQISRHSWFPHNTSTVKHLSTLLQVWSEASPCEQVRPIWGEIVKHIEMKRESLKPQHSTHCHQQRAPLIAIARLSLGVEQKISGKKNLAEHASFSLQFAR